MAPWFTYLPNGDNYIGRRQDELLANHLSPLHMALKPWPLLRQVSQQFGVAWWLITPSSTTRWCMITSIYGKNYAIRPLYEYKTTRLRHLATKTKMLENDASMKTSSFSAKSSRIPRNAEQKNSVNIRKGLTWSLKHFALEYMNSWQWIAMRSNNPGMLLTWNGITTKSLYEPKKKMLYEPKKEKEKETRARYSDLSIVIWTTNG